MRATTWCGFAVLALLGSLPAQADPSPLPDKTVAAGMKRAKCSVPLKDAVADTDISFLTKPLKLLIVPCWRATYNAGSIVFVFDPKKPRQAKLLRFESWDGKKFTLEYSLSNAGFDPEIQMLFTTHKGRGVGDCGNHAKWRWTGIKFEMRGYWVKPDCDGEPFDDEYGQDKWRVFPKR